MSMALDSILRGNGLTAAQPETASVHSDGDWARPDAARSAQSADGLNPSLTRALDIARQGGKVFPCHWIEQSDCSCGKSDCARKGKHPLWEKGTLEHGKDDATCDEEQIRAWAAKWPRANWAFVPGSLNWVVIDMDGDAGVQAFKVLPGYEKLPKTFWVKTGREGGFHVYLALPPGVTVKEGDIVPRVLTVKCKGYVMLDGCQHLSGRQYTAVDPTAPVALCPEWLLNHIQEAQGAQTRQSAPTAGAVVNEPISKGKRTNRLVSLAGTMHKRGMAPDAIEAALLKENALFAPPLREAKVRAIAHDIPRRYPNAESGAHDTPQWHPEPNEPASSATAEETGPALPTITVTPGESPKAVDEAEEILLANSERLGVFQRSGEVVRAVRLSKSKHSCGLQREVGTIQLAPVGQVALTEMFDRLITWHRVRAPRDGAEAVRIDCPGKIAAAYLSRIGSWRLPLLVGVISAPIMRPDGSVLCRAGYDEATGLYLTEDWPDLNGNPARDDAVRGLETLRRPFEEFPFVAREDESVLLVAILTALQRRLLASAPLFAFKAPSQRTGKTLLAECMAVIATGRPAPAMAVSGDREEMRKAVAAALREGHVIVNLDNIEHPLGSPDLSRAITQPEYSDRLLGETKMLRLPTNVTWTATGNNLAFRGDLAVRALVCRLDARLERPEERSFMIADLKGHITEHRHELVAAALTIPRAYVLAGEPDQKLKPWGGFDEWSRTVRAALVWSGMPDPCATRQHVIEDDPDREQAATLLSAWHSEVGADPIQIARLVGLAANTPELRAALLGVAAARNDGGQIDPRRLSWWCREWRDRVVSGLVLAKDKDYGKSASWRVKPSDRAGCGISGVSGIKNASTNVPDKPMGFDLEGMGRFYRGGNNPTDPTNPKNGPDEAVSDPEERL